MKRQVLSLTICIATAALCLAVAVQSAPKECMKETSDYNESDCREKCKEEANKGQPYCSSFLPTERPDSTSSTSSGNQGSDSSNTSGITGSSGSGGGSGSGSGGSSGSSGSGGNSASSASSGSGGSGNSTSSAISVASSLAISASCFVLSYFI